MSWPLYYVAVSFKRIDFQFSILAIQNIKQENRKNVRTYVPIHWDGLRDESKGQFVKCGSQAYCVYVYTRS